jgi:hypothetical protein
MRIAGTFPCRAFKAVDVFRGSGLKVFVVFAAAISLAGCDLPFGSSRRVPAPAGIDPATAEISEDAAVMRGLDLRIHILRKRVLAKMDGLPGQARQ